MDHKDGISGFRKFAITVSGSINWSPTSGIYGCSLEHSLSGEQLPRPAYYAIIDRRARRPIRVLRPRNEGGGAPPTFSFVHASASTDVSLYWPRNSCCFDLDSAERLEWIMLRFLITFWYQYSKHDRERCLWSWLSFIISSSIRVIIFLATRGTVCFCRPSLVRYTKSIKL